jgi:hypothetical protein
MLSSQSMKKIFVAILCVFGLSQCHHKVYTFDNLPKQFIEIGSYGGFAGTSKSFYFLPNGQRFMNEGVLGAEDAKNAIEIEKAEPKDFRAMTKGLRKMDFKKIELNEIGNMTYYIRLKSKKKDKKIQWSTMDTAPASLVSFYKESVKNIKTEAIN